MTSTISEALEQSRAMLDNFINTAANTAQLERASQLLIERLRAGNSIYSCGNGGSMSDAMHFAEELSGRYRNSRPALSATAISDPGHITCVANDFGYEYIFSRYLEACAKQGDCLLAISTSGSSKNVIKAAQYARENGILVIGLTGKTGSALGEICDIDISVGASDYADRIQEMHIKVIHILIEQVERALFPQNYSS
ncbi:MAG: D-sedoheptulose-7-phosphate isomerase [Pseudomonadales bacterium]